MICAKYTFTLVAIQLHLAFSFKIEDFFGLGKNMETNSVSNVDKREIFFQSYTRKFPYPQDIDEDNVDQIETGKPVKVLIHGWGGNENVRAYKNISQEYFKKGDYNIIHVDWRRVAALAYPMATAYSKDVGKIISSFLINLNRKKAIPFEEMHLIGISLGAHIAGFTGKEIKQRTKKQLGRITGLDPAGPLFEFPPTTQSNRLAKDDAKVVDVIHTDGGVVGILQPVGNIDFYPNGGIRPQEGCPILPKDTNIYRLDKVADSFFCGHSKAVEFFIRSINSKEFVAVRCKSWLEFEFGKCKENKINIMGDNLIPERKGSFYLVIN